MKNTIRQKKQPVNNYFSQCCSVLADKEPCARQPEDVKAGKFSESTLGKWRCSKCRKSCKVTPVKAEKK